jgi:predicted DNA-binding transcriptional regulator AlpA
MPKRRARRAVKANTKTKPRHHQPPTTPTIAPVVLRSRDAAAFVGLGPTQFSKHVKAGNLPPPIKLTDNGRAVGWLVVDLQGWLQARVAKRDAGRAA